MANANAVQVQASKFFAAPSREVITLSEGDYETLAAFKSAIAEAMTGLVQGNAELRFQHKSFVRGTTWSIDLNKLSTYGASVGVKIAQVGSATNGYTWRMVPRTTLVAEQSLF
jgi:hypothetical protein